MTARPSLFAHREEPVHRARHGAAQKQQVPLGVHFHDAEAQLGEVPRSHVPGHALPLDDARRVGTRRDRAGLPMPRIAVGFGAAAEVMTVHDALEPPTFGHPRDLDAVAGGEDRDGDRFARLWRSEEHTSELQSHSNISYAVFCLKKKKTQTKITKLNTTEQKKTNI